jgi:chaperonin cofactor prefoldin
MALDPVGFFKNLSPNLKKGLAALLVLVLVGATGFWYGRHSAPEKTIEVIDTTTKTKLEETTAQLTKLQQSYATLQQQKDKVVTETKVVHDRVVAADKDTKCDETFDRKTGKLIHRVCERSTHTTDTQHDEALAKLTQEKETLSTQVTTLSTENLTLKNKLQEAETHTHTEKTVINNVKDNWLVGGGAGLTLNSPGMTYGAQGAYRVIGPFWLGPSVSIGPSAKTLSLNLIMTLP